MAAESPFILHTSGVLNTEDVHGCTAFITIFH